MGIMDDLKRSENLDRVPDLLRWGHTDFPKNPKGYAVSAEELGDSGKINWKISGEFKVLSVFVNEFEDNTVKISFKLAGAEPGLSQGDQFNWTLYLRADELEKPDGFLQEKTFKEFSQLVKFCVTNNLLPEGWNPDDYDTIIADIAAAVQQFPDPTVWKAGFRISQYVKDGELKGPYLSLNYLNANPATPF